MGIQNTRKCYITCLFTKHPSGVVLKIAALNIFKKSLGKTSTMKYLLANSNFDLKVLIDKFDSVNWGPSQIFFSEKFREFSQSLWGVANLLKMTQQINTEQGTAYGKLVKLL